MPRRLLILATAACALAIPACTRLGLIRSADARLVSAESDATLSPDFRLLVHHAEPGDPATDLYFTDLTDDEIDTFFDESGAWTDIRGSIVHLHLFIRPYAGRTPIEPTAANATVRWAVLAQGELGVYTGAGFVLPSRSIAGSNLAGDLSGATLRLTHATGGFHDALGPARLTMGFTTEPDETLARELERRLDAIARRAAPVEVPEVIDDPTP
ncbi:MAG: hypothetical protein ACF8Q5_05875 [Phycisphaerales bacterium JB040]